MPITLSPGSREEWLEMRKADITSTESPALFDASPYLTDFELALQKRGTIPSEIPDNDRMMIGREMEDTIARMAAEKMGWKVRRVNRYMRHSETPRMGSSFDYEIISHVDGIGNLEVKNLDRSVYYNDWAEGDGANEAPVHIELQTQHQMEVRDCNWSAIVALVGGNDLKIIMRERDREVGAGICDAVTKFWEQFDQGKNPPYQLPRDAAAIMKLYGDGTGAPFDARGDEEIVSLMRRYSEAGAAQKAAQELKDEIKAKILMRVGNASKVITDVGSISLGMTKGSTYTVTREPGRMFRVNLKKGEK